MRERHGRQDNLRKNVSAQTNRGIIEISHLTVSADGKYILNNFSTRFSSVDVTALLGLSGSGKTTLLRVLLGLQKPDAGTVTGLDGLRIGTVFQEDRLLPWATVRENLVQISDCSRADWAIGKMALTELSGQLPGTLSGGEKRRVSIARALAYGGDYLLLDEPFTGMDPQKKAQAAKALVENARGMLLITHDPTELELMGATRQIRLGEQGLDD